MVEVLRTEDEGPTKLRLDKLFETLDKKMKDKNQLFIH